MVMHDLERRGRTLRATVGARELAVLLSALTAGGGLLIFAEVADEVVEDETRSLECTLLLALRNPADAAHPIGPVWFQDMARDLTALGSIPCRSSSRWRCAATF
jgi:undecaprenyl-diphosphatase